jgi:AcrR family transcriptional regulator
MPRSNAPSRNSGLSNDARLVAIAADHLRRFGRRRLTVVGVAEEAGMTHANVYRYFPSKEALVDSVVEAWLKSVERRLADIVDGPDPAEDKLERLVLAMAQANRVGLSEDPRLFEALKDSLGRRSAVTRRHRSRVRHLIERVVDDGISTAAFEPRDRDRAVAVVIDATHRFVHPVAIELEAGAPQATTEARLNALIRVVLRALATGTV